MNNEQSVLGTVKIALKEFGLEPDEIMLYLAGVKLGESSLSELATQAKIKRTSAYAIAERLKEKGLMGSFKMKSGMRFVATNPNQLEKIAEKKLSDIKNIIPKLNLISNQLRVKPEVSVYTGKDGYLNVFNDPLKYQNITIRAIGSLQKLRTVITSDYDEKKFVPERLHKGIDFKGLYFKKEVEKMGLSNEKNIREKREIKILPEKYFQPVFTMIYENTVVKFTSQKEMIALKIVSAEIAEAERKNFDLIWDLIGEK